MNYQYLWSCMASTFWVDCRLISLNSPINDKAVISFYNDYSGEEEEREVPVSDIRYVGSGVIDPVTASKAKVVFSGS